MPRTDYNTRWNRCSSRADDAAGGIPIGAAACQQLLLGDRLKPALRFAMLVRSEMPLFEAPEAPNGVI